VLDFSSALYLGLWHGSGELRSWTQFTTGVPASLATPLAALEVARELAELQGCEHATLATSTLHVFWDLFVGMGGRDSVIFVDAGTYPIAQWGIERAAARGITVRRFGPHDPESLRAMVLQEAGHKRPLVVTEGFCPGCGTTAPLADFLAIARERQGWLVLDDTQALGIFGRPAGQAVPYGTGGGGMLQRAQISGPDIVAVSSLAKGFGVPLAVLAGTRELVARFEAHSETRMHCSPPAIATLRSAEHALQVNREQGDAIRLRLARLVHAFRTQLRGVGLYTGGGIFPVQTLKIPREASAAQMHTQLLRSGVRCVLHRMRHAADLGLSFLITARHTSAQLDHAAKAVAIASPLGFDSVQTR
jgi:8-amino-7-oxononanoate synthase